MARPVRLRRAAGWALGAPGATGGARQGASELLDLYGRGASLRLDRQLGDAGRPAVDANASRTEYEAVARNGEIEALDAQGCGVAALNG